MVNEKSEPESRLNNEEEQEDLAESLENFPEEVVEVLEDLPPDAKKLMGTVLSIRANASKLVLIKYIICMML